jgi:hypothetical protein
MLDGAHAETDAKNLANYLKSLKASKIWYLGNDEK